MKRVISTVLVMAIGGSLLGCQSSDSTQTDTTIPTQQAAMTMMNIEGTLAYRERIALPNDAVITVTLEDISLADAPAIVLNTQTFIADGAQAPFNFKLSYDPSKIIATHRYGVRANIKVQNQLRFTTDTTNLVITDPNQTHQLNLRLKGIR